MASAAPALPLQAAPRRSRALRVALTGVAVFLVAQVAAVVMHGFVRAKDYEPFRGTLLRAVGGSATPPWQMAFLPVMHVSLTIGLVWLTLALAPRREHRMRRGVRTGVMVWLIASVPPYLMWFAEQPWPG